MAKMDDLTLLNFLKNEEDRAGDYVWGRLAEDREQAMREGMKPLRIGGALKVAQGITTIDEVLKVAPPVIGDRRKAAP